MTISSRFWSFDQTLYWHHLCRPSASTCHAPVPFITMPAEAVQTCNCFNLHTLKVRQHNLVIGDITKKTYYQGDTWVVLGPWTKGHDNEAPPFQNITTVDLNISCMCDASLLPYPQVSKVFLRCGKPLGSKHAFSISGNRLQPAKMCSR